MPLIICKYMQKSQRMGLPGKCAQGKNCKEKGEIKLSKRGGFVIKLFPPKVLQLSNRKMGASETKLFKKRCFSNQAIKKEVLAIKLSKISLAIQLHVCRYLNQKPKNTLKKKYFIFIFKLLFCFASYGHYGLRANVRPLMLCFF